MLRTEGPDAIETKESDTALHTSCTQRKYERIRKIPSGIGAHIDHRFLITATLAASGDFALVFAMRVVVEQDECVENSV